MYTKDEENFIILSSVEEISDAVKRALVFKCADTERQDIEKFLIKTLSYGVYNTVKEKFFRKLSRYIEAYRQTAASSLLQGQRFASQNKLLCRGRFAEKYG